MSGPKLSQAEIERQQRARMEKRREEYLRRAAGLRRRKEQMRQWYDSETYQKLKQESPAAAGTVRRELEEGIRGLEEGLLRLEEIPVLDQQPLDSYSELLEKAEQKNQEVSVLLENGVFQGDDPQQKEQHRRRQGHIDPAAGEEDHQYIGGHKNPGGQQFHGQGLPSAYMSHILPSPPGGSKEKPG